MSWDGIHERCKAVLSGFIYDLLRCHILKLMLMRGMAWGGCLAVHFKFSSMSDEEVEFLFNGLVAPVLYR